MTYLDQARAGDFYHEFAEGRCVCGTLEDRGTFPNRCLPCPAKIARFAREKVIAEIEALAKERCARCASGFEPDLYGCHRDVNQTPCLAQPEQRRLAILRAELPVPAAQLADSGDGAESPAPDPKHAKQP